MKLERVTPRSTYRLQLHAGFDFDAAAATPPPTPPPGTTAFSPPPPPPRGARSSAGH